MSISKLPPPDSFRTGKEARQLIADACRRHSDLAKAKVIGESEEGRPILGVELGRGERSISLVAGNHSDEPVGPETLRTLILEGLSRRDELQETFDAFRFLIVPHTNPDGEAKNRRWIVKWPDVRAYMLHAFREPPGRDMEFGFPDLREENRCVSDFLGRGAPYAMHASLHGMGFSDGALLLIERTWGFRTDALQKRFISDASKADLSLHDRNRKGEKGFFYLGPGFNTTPEGEAMRTYFQAQGDDETAGMFLDSSMEFVRGLGGDPLCLVTELPLFVLEGAGLEEYLRFREQLPEWREKLKRGEDVDLAAFAPRPLPIGVGVRLQLQVLEAGLEAVANGA